MIVGGEGYRDASVLKYESTFLDNSIQFSDPIYVARMKEDRDGHACTIFNSGLHNGRPVIIVAGGAYRYGSAENWEMWDFTQEGATWQICNLFFLSTLFIFSYFSKIE